MAGTTEGNVAERFERAGLEDVTGGALAAHADHQEFDDFWEPLTFAAGPADPDAELEGRPLSVGGEDGLPR